MWHLERELVISTGKYSIHIAGIVSETRTPEPVGVRCLGAQQLGDVTCHQVWHCFSLCGMSMLLVRVFAKPTLHGTYIVRPLQRVDSYLPGLFQRAFTDLHNVCFNVPCYLPLVHLSYICGIILLNFAFAIDLNNLTFCSPKSLCGGFYLGHSYCRYFIFPYGLDSRSCDAEVAS